VALASCSQSPGDREADEGFTKPADYAITQDWNHINPYGAADKGRDATMKTVGMFISHS
jgi:hypothetical protein